jgi:hypothetical protein
MGTSFKFSFEQVQLLSGLSQNQAVYLLMQLKAYDPDTPDDPFYSEVVGGLSPNDANDPSGNIVSGTGFYAASLPVGKIVRNDVPDSYPAAPRFSLGPVSVEPNQIVELSIVLAPEVWFNTVNVPASDWDKVLAGIFMGALGAGGFGIAGGVAGAVLGFLGFGASDQDVTVPCYNVVIMARHQWTGADVASNAGGLMQFGPTGPDPSYGCDRIDSFYWLSITQQMQFDTRPPWKKGDCTLDGVSDPASVAWLKNDWGDQGDMTLDCCRAIVYPANGGTWNVDIWEPRKLILAPAPVQFRNVPVTYERPTPVFRRNIYPNKECPARSALPNCPMCSRFTNVDNGMYLPGKLVLGVGLRASHIGSRPLLSVSFDNNKVLGAGPTRIVPLTPLTQAQRPPAKNRHKASGRPDEKISKHRDDSKVSASPSAAIRVNPSTTLYRPAGDMVVLTPKWNIAQLDLKKGGISVFPEAITLRLSPQRVLYLYGEYPADGHLQCFRLRYRRTGDDGLTMTDLMLLPDAAVIR